MATTFFPRALGSFSFVGVSKAKENSVPTRELISSSAPFLQHWLTASPPSSFPPTIRLKELDIRIPVSLSAVSQGPPTLPSITSTSTPSSSATPDAPSSSSASAFQVDSITTSTLTIPSPSPPSSPSPRIPISSFAYASLPSSRFLASLSRAKERQQGDYERQSTGSTKGRLSTLGRLFGAPLAAAFSFFSWNGPVSIDDALARLGFEERKMAGDGNCMFRALADQLYDNQEEHPVVRGQLVSWLRGNGKFDVSGRGEGTYLEHFLERDRYPNWNAYCETMSRNGAWGDHIMLKAASEVYRARIFVVSAAELQKKTADTFDPERLVELVAAPTAEQHPGEAQEYKEFFLSHWPEVHYNSLRRHPSPPPSPSPPLSPSLSATPSPPSTPTVSPPSSPRF